ncbi:hypothetical protein AVEN_134119-1, partial [Araneus ventricosus]
DADPMKNVGVTGGRTVRSLVHRDKVRRQSATLGSETDGRPSRYLWRTIPLSINEVYQARIIGRNVVCQKVSLHLGI